MLSMMMRGVLSVSSVVSSLPTVEPPIALGVINREQFDAVLAKGVASKVTGSYLISEEVKRKFAMEFSL